MDKFKVLREDPPEPRPKIDWARRTQDVKDAVETGWYRIGQWKHPTTANSYKTFLSRRYPGIILKTYSNKYDKISKLYMYKS